MIKDQLLEKIKKLLALSNSSNPHEAAAALLRAQKLMEKYNIEKESLSVGDSDISYIELIPIKGLTTKRINKYIGSIIAKAFGVEAVYLALRSSVEKIIFFGHMDVLETCEYIYTILARSILAARRNHAIGVKTEAFDMICRFNEHDIKTLLKYDRLDRSLFNLLKEQVFLIRENNLKDALEGHSQAISNMKKADKLIDDFFYESSDSREIIKEFVSQSKKGFIEGFLSSVYKNIPQYNVDNETKKQILEVISEYCNGTKVTVTKDRGACIRTEAGCRAYKKGSECGSSVSICNAIKNRAKTRKQLTNES